MENIDLLHYIDQARKSGMKDEEIRQGLFQSGWQADNVNEAMTKAPMTVVLPSKSKLMMSKHLAASFIIIAIAVAGYFAGAYYMANFQSFPLWPFEVNVPVPTFTPRPSPTHLEAKLPSEILPDWKTYRNEEYGFEVKYPQTWEVLIDFPNKQEGFQIGFRDEKYKNALDWTGLILQSYPENYTNYIEAQSFSRDNIEDLLKYKVNTQYIYGSCTNYDDDIIDTCNQILSTFRFIR